VSAVTYTILSGAVTTPVFPGVYEFGQPHLRKTVASVAAFLTPVGLQFGSAVLYAHIR
jgi:hypothetical protein